MAKKNAAAVALGRLGGKKRVPKGLSKVSPERRAEISRAGAAARWGMSRATKKSNAKKAEGTKGS
jgi:hypothetical protein